MSAEADILADKRRLHVLRTQIRVLDARKGMRGFGHFMLPDQLDYDNPDATEFQWSAPTSCLCQLIEEIEIGKKKRVAVAMAPQSGKTLTLSQLGAVWILGRNPRAKIIVSTYNENRASKLGRDVLKLLKSARYNQIFPEVQLVAESQHYIETSAGGYIMFVGAGGTITGNPADYFIIDDPIKGEDDESDLTPQALEQLWAWFFKVAYSRGSDKTRIIITHTRWAEDDLIGRLCDPSHPERGPGKKYHGKFQDWFYLNLSAIIKDKALADLLGLKLEVPTDPLVIKEFGPEPLTSLWPENKSPRFYAEWKEGDERTFSALAMGQPAPENGSYFLKDWLREYHMISDIPDNLRVYGASDHAVSTKQQRDSTVIGKIGIDEHDDIWVLPDLVWAQMETDRTVEELLRSFRHATWKPVLWWAEDENISKAFGPFLRKRMSETGTYTTTLDPIRPARDLRTRARSIQGRMAQRKVIFPAFAPWYGEARAQMLRFPYASHDDFIAWLALIGLGLTKEYAADAVVRKPEMEHPVGSIGWLLAHKQDQMDSVKSKGPVGW